MKPTLRITLSACSLLLASVPSSLAQRPGFDPFSQRSCATLYGSVAEVAGAKSGVSAELRSLTGGGLPELARIQNGGFEVGCVPVGNYDVRVLDSQGKLVHSEEVALREGHNDVHIVLTERKTEESGSPSVSVRQLQRKTDKKAEGEVRKAEDAAKHRKFDEAIEHSQKALERDPEYSPAFVMLGVAYAGMERHDEALKHFTKATELDPDSALAHSNLAITMLRLQRYQPAEQEARRALKLGGSLPQMEFALGVSLGAQGKQLDEAVQHLDRAGSDIPRAKIAAVKLLAAAGRRDDALHRIEQYLRNSGNTQERNDLESLRSSLNK